MPRRRRPLTLLLTLGLLAGACSGDGDDDARGGRDRAAPGEAGGAGNGGAAGGNGDTGPGHEAGDAAGGSDGRAGGENAGGSPGGGGGSGQEAAGDGDGSGPPRRPAGWRAVAKSPLKGRHAHSAVWTGEEMIVWGGATRAGNAPIYLDDGAAYDPARDKWRRIASSPLSARADHVAAWTGEEMIVWGGLPGTETPLGNNEFVDGARYDPEADDWEPMARFPLAARYAARAVWTGTRLVVWGGTRAEAGEDPPPLTSGAAYDPALDRWTELPEAPVEPRLAPLAAAVDGDALFSWGFTRTGSVSDGARYDPVEQRWTEIAAVPETDAARCFDLAGCVGVDTGDRIVFAGEGLVYEPAADRWSAIAPSPFADPYLDGKATAWTGRAAVVWGGGRYEGEDDGPPAEVPANPAGMAYDPAANTWTPLPDGPLAPRARARGVWTGAEFIVWGGESTYRERTQHADGAGWTP